MQFGVVVVGDRACARRDELLRPRNSAAGVRRLCQLVAQFEAARRIIRYNQLFQDLLLAVEQRRRVAKLPVRVRARLIVFVDFQQNRRVGFVAHPQLLDSKRMHRRATTFHRRDDLLCKLVHVQLVLVHRWPNAGDIGGNHDDITVFRERLFHEGGIDVNMRV